MKGAGSGLGTFRVNTSEPSICIGESNVFLGQKRMNNSNLSEICGNNSIRMMPVSPSASFLGHTNQTNNQNMIKNQEHLMMELEKSLGNYRKAEVQIEKYKVKIDDLKSYKMKQVDNLNKIIETFMAENGALLGLAAGSDKNSTLWQYS